MVSDGILVVDGPRHLLAAYYVRYLDDAGNPASAIVIAPGEELARSAIGPREIEAVVQLPDPGGPDPRAVDWIDEDTWPLPVGAGKAPGADGDT